MLSAWILTDLPDTSSFTRKTFGEGIPMTVPHRSPIIHRSVAGWSSTRVPMIGFMVISFRDASCQTLSVTPLIEALDRIGPLAPGETDARSYPIPIPDSLELSNRVRQ